MTKPKSVTTAHLRYLLRLQARVRAEEKKKQAIVKAVVAIIDKLFPLSASPSEVERLIARAKSRARRRGKT
jgi:FKBP-type peptidyl-prolyl cis-trans isomerase (trigger factor)